MPPVELFRTDYNFAVPDTYTENYITLLTTSNTPGIILDGTAFNFSSAVAIKDSLGTYGYKLNYKISAGSHTLTSTTRVGVTVVGYGSYVSYAYVAGLDLSYSPY